MVKTQQEILAKLGIEKLNSMQRDALAIIPKQNDVVLLSPTGTGKTLAFLLPIIEMLDPSLAEVQAIVVAPTRELAIQIEQVARDMGTGYKTNVVYGGRTGSQDRMNIKHRPAILVGTPGRISDHLRREAFDASFVRTLVLDEFDKSLEIGFEDEMIDILDLLPRLNKKVLTSATQDLAIPKFVGLEGPTKIDFLFQSTSKLALKEVVSPDKDKLDCLVETLMHIGNKPGIVFCNFKDTIARVSERLREENIAHGTFYGGMEQRDREEALIKFRNGTHQVLLATDLAARGIDIPELAFIIHYQLPNREVEFTHRNGRTARMNAAGTAYILNWKDADLPDYMPAMEEEVLTSKSRLKPSEWTTLYISGGKRDKISKGDVAGLMMKQAGLKPFQVGVIEIQLDAAFVAVHSLHVKQAVKATDNTRLKKKKVKVKQV